jgi:hypothetical protein
MELLNFFAMIGRHINDLLAIFSVVSAFIMLFGNYSYGDLANYSILGLLFGGLFQISMFVTGTMPARIGVIVPMTPLVVNGLFELSLLMVIARWLLGRHRSGPR